MKLLYLIPGRMGNSKLGEEEMQRRCAILNQYAFPGTMVDVWDACDGPASIESLTEEYEAIPGTIRRAVEAEKAGYDGIILGCFADLGIDAIREMVNIPVAGPFETALGAALTTGYRFSIVTATSAMVSMLEEECSAKGIRDRRLASVRAVDVNILDFNEQAEQLKEKVLEQGKRCIQEDQADTLILGCISLAFAGVDRLLEEKLGVPCINPILTALKYCEGCVSMKLTHSKKAFPLPLKLQQEKENL